MVGGRRGWEAYNTSQTEVILGSMKSRQIEAVAVMLLGGIGCMKADRVVAVQMGIDMDAGEWPAFSAPTLVTGLTSDDTYEHHPSLTDDELEIYFSSSETGANFQIWSSTRTTSNAAWNPASIVTELSSSGTNEDPDISPNGLTLYFASNRAGAGYRLYVSQRTARDQPWSAPAEMLGLGTSTLDMGPSVDPTGLFMVFESERGTSAIDSLYSASRTDPLGAWGNVEALSGINSTIQDEDPALFNESLSLVWSSRGPSNGKTSDLFQVSRTSVSVPFSGTPIPLASLNTPDYWEGDPWLSQDGTHILFVSDRNGFARIYEAWRYALPDAGNPR